MDRITIIIRIILICFYGVTAFALYIGSRCLGFTVDGVDLGLVACILVIATLENFYHRLK